MSAKSQQYQYTIMSVASGLVDMWTARLSDTGT